MVKIDYFSKIVKNNITSRLFKDVSTIVDIETDTILVNVNNNVIASVSLTNNECRVLIRICNKIETSRKFSSNNVVKLTNDVSCFICDAIR